MARQSKKNRQERLHSGEAIELRFADILAATCPPEKPHHIIWDLLVRGLGLRVSPTGRKSIILSSKVKGKEGFKSYKVVLQDVTHLGMESTPLNLDEIRAKARRIKAECSDKEMTPLEIEQEADRQRQLELAKQQAIEEEKRRLEIEAASYTLGALCEAYWNSLQRQGKQSHKEARNVLTKHVIKAHPELANTQANKVTKRQIADLLKLMVDNGLGRTVMKCRSYLVAAYNFALNAEGNIIAPGNMSGFNVETNPAQGTSAKDVRQLSKPRERELDLSELREYLLALKAMPESLYKDALMLSLYLGGQRIAQTIRIQRADVDLYENTVLLRDGKGVRDTPRLHRLPLIPEALEILERLDRRAARESSALLFQSSTKEGVTVSARNISAIGNELTDKLYRTGKCKAPFKILDIRRTIETKLAEAGISSDVRAQLQSHGISGIQARHYDKYDYMARKKHALITWAQIVADALSGKEPARKVIELRAINGE